MNKEYKDLYIQTAKNGDMTNFLNEIKDELPVSFSIGIHARYGKFINWSVSYAGENYLHPDLREALIQIICKIKKI